jgi:tetratricopeptide (TPR) repeat protein
VRRLLEQGEAEAARDGLARLERLAPDAFQTKELLALALKAQGKSAEGVVLLEAFVTRPGAPEEYLSRVAAVLEKWGQTAVAEWLLRRYADRSPGPASGLALAEFLARQARMDEALNEVERVRVKCSPARLAQSCVGILICGPRTDQHCRRTAVWIEEALKQASERGPPTVSLMAHLGAVYSWQGRYAEAEQLFRQALAQKTPDPEALNLLAAQLALKDGKARGEEALSLANRAWEALGANPGVLETRAVVYLALGRHHEAVEDLEDALAVQRSPSCLLHLARAHLLAGNRPQAIAAWKKAREAGLKPDRLHPLEQPFHRELATRLGES